MALSHEDIEAQIVGLLERRDEGKTICPSEAARALAEDWRPLMPEVREVAYGMADEGRLEVTQSGRVVDGRSAHGPIRLRLP
jgi:hypothetical protein